VCSYTAFDHIDDRERARVTVRSGSVIMVIYIYCCWPAGVPAVVSARVVLESAAVAHPWWPDICQPESGVPTPEG